MPPDVSANGHLVDGALHSAGVAIAVALALAILGLAFALARRGGPRPDSRSAIVVVLGCAAFVALAIDARLLIRSEAALPKLLDAPEGALRVEVNARQWSWSFRQAGPDGALATPDDVVTADELVVPVDRTVELQLAAADVIHSFYLPNLRVKVDAIPGTITHAFFIATVVGSYDIACAQYCGANHYKMRGRLRVLSAADYGAWLAAAGASSGAGYDPDDVAAHWGWPWTH